MSEAPTTWELQRSIEALRSEMRESFKQVNARLDRGVSAELFAQYQGYIAQRFVDVEKDLEAEAKHSESIESRRAADRRLVVSAIVGPLALMVLQLVLAATGGGV